MRRRLPRVGAPGAVVAIAILASVLVLLQLSRSLWFFGDDWEFLLRRSITGPAQYSLLHPHNEHWVTLPIIEYRVLYTVFGLRYLPFAAFVIAAHAVATWLLYLVLRRVGAGAWPAAIAGVVFAFLGGASEDLLWAFQSEFIGPVALALAALLVCESGMRPRPQLVAVWVLLVAGLMCSGMGVTMTIWVAAYALLRHGWWRGISVAVVPGAVYLLWLATFGGSSISHSSASREYIAQAMLNGAANIWQQVLPLPGVGGPILLALVAASIFAPAPPALRALARAGMATLVPFFLLISYSRVAIAASEAALASRYVYIGMVLTVPAFAVALGWLGSLLVEEPLVALVGAVALAVLVVGSGIGQMVVFRDQRSAMIGDGRARLVAGVRLVDGDQVLLSSALDPTFNPDLDLRTLAEPDLRARLPDVRVSRKTRLDASGAMQVGVQGRPFKGVTRSAPALSYNGPGDVRTVDGCLRGYAQGGHLQFAATPGGGQFSLRTAGSEVVTLLARGSAKSAALTRQLGPAGTSWIGTSADAQLRVRIPTGSFTACGSPAGPAS